MALIEEFGDATTDVLAEVSHSDEMEVFLMADASQLKTLTGLLQIGGIRNLIKSRMQKICPR